ncbi:MAG: hypothetical protein V7L13_19250 [Nostoc sp.]|uniref:hypothetical protein n=1 Tax=Nostoc sp. TaxID=1180 RepID=UPI002FF88799
MFNYFPEDGYERRQEAEGRSAIAQSSRRRQEKRSMNENFPSLREAAPTTSSGTIVLGDYPVEIEDTGARRAARDIKLPQPKSHVFKSGLLLPPDCYSSPFLIYPRNGLKNNFGLSTTEEMTKLVLPRQIRKAI